MLKKRPDIKNWFYMLPYMKFKSRQNQSMAIKDWWLSLRAVIWAGGAIREATNYPQRWTDAALVHACVFIELHTRTCTNLNLCTLLSVSYTLLAKKEIANLTYKNVIQPQNLCCQCSNSSERMVKWTWRKKGTTCLGESGEAFTERGCLHLEGW